MTWKLLVLVGSAVVVVAFLLGSIPSVGGCGSPLFPGPLDAYPTSANFDNPDYQPLICAAYGVAKSGACYWVAIALGAVVLIAGFIVRSQLSSKSESAAD